MTTRILLLLLAIGIGARAWLDDDTWARPVLLTLAVALAGTATVSLIREKRRQNERARWAKEAS